MLNAILHHVGMSWIISSNEEMKYEIDKNNHQDFLNKGTWYNTAICLRLHRSLFGYLIKYAISDRYNIMCYLVEHDKIQPAYEEYESSIGDMSITKNATTKTLEELCATINFIDIWLKPFEDNYDARRVAYITSMKEMSKQIPQTMIKELTTKQKVQKLMTNIGGGW